MTQVHDILDLIILQEQYEVFGFNSIEVKKDEGIIA